MPTDSVCFSTVSPVRSPDISNPQHKTNIYIWNCTSIITSNCKCCPAWCWFSTKDLTKCAVLAPFLSPPLPTISFDSLTLPEWHSDVADVFQVPKDNSGLLFLLLRFFIAFYVWPTTHERPLCTWQNWPHCCEDVDRQHCHQQLLWFTFQAVHEKNKCRHW